MDGLDDSGAGDKVCDFISRGRLPLNYGCRFVKDPPPPFKTQTDASNAFAAHARQLLQSELETPSISRVQALLMLTGHDWGAGNGRRGTGCASGTLGGLFR